MLMSAIVKIFSFGERLNLPSHWAVVLDGKFHLAPHENIFIIILINIHFLYTKYHKSPLLANVYWLSCLLATGNVTYDIRSFQQQQNLCKNTDIKKF
jgi:hypothetical protein